MQNGNSIAGFLRGVALTGIYLRKGRHPGGTRAPLAVVRLGAQLRRRTLLHVESFLAAQDVWHVAQAAQKAVLVVIPVQTWDESSLRHDSEKYLLVSVLSSVYLCSA